MQDTVELFITPDKQEYNSNEFIVGEVNLKTREPLNVEKITLKVRKFYKGLIEVEGADVSRNDIKKMALKEERVVYEYDFNLFDDEGDFTKVSSGHHTFPFKFKLKSSDSSSVNFQQYFSNLLCEIKNTYTLESSLKLFGIYKHLLNTKKELVVIDNQNDTHETSMKIKLSSCFCIFRESFVITSSFEKKVHYSGDVAALHLQVSNINSNVRIKAVEAYLYQVISLYVEDKFITRVKHLSKNKNVVYLQDGLCISKIEIPHSAPSSTSEKLFDIRYILYMFITFNRSSPIRIKKALGVVKRIHDIVDGEELSVLNGHEFPVKYLTLG